MLRLYEVALAMIVGSYAIEAAYEIYLTGKTFIRGGGCNHNPYELNLY